jgi:hypothetical protein
MLEQNRTNIIWMVAIAVVIVLVIVWAGWPVHPPPAVAP